MTAPAASRPTPPPLPPSRPPGPSSPPPPPGPKRNIESHAPAFDLSPLKPGEWEAFQGARRQRLAELDALTTGLPEAAAALERRTKQLVAAVTAPGVVDDCGPGAPPPPTSAPLPDTAPRAG